MSVPAPPSGAPPVLRTEHDDLSMTVFQSLNWVFFGLCIVAFATRAYIRCVCFRRLLFEDYIMLLALVLHSAESIIIQVCIGFVYDMEAVGRGDMAKAQNPNFLHNTKTGFVALGVCINLAIIGVLLVKLNFMLFFRPIGAHLKWFLYLWWAVLLFTVAGAAAQIGMQDFTCFFGSSEEILGPMCTSIKTVKRVFMNSIFSAVVDAVSDFLIIGFPAAILWKSRISRRKKVVLTLIFGLVFLTIAITIVRGSIFHDVYDIDRTAKMQSASFTWFWFYCEFTVAFIIACIVSFRTLFVHRENNSRARYEEELHRRAAYHSALRRGWRNKARSWQESVLETCKTLEGWSGSEAETLHPGKHGLPEPPIGLMTVDFNDDGNWAKNLSKSGYAANGTNGGIHVQRSVSVQSLIEPQESHARA